MGRFGDKYVTSILCDGKVIVDNQCFMHTPKIFIDEAITVSIGGDVNMAATTIDFRNSTIDFNGATLENFTGNISGNISGNLTVDSISALVISAYAFFGNLYGNVTGTYINGDHITSSIGLHGTLFTSSIIEKISGGGVTVTGALNASTFGLHTGNVIGGIKTNLIRPQSGTTTTIQATNTNVTNNFTVNGTTTFNNNVNVNGNITLTNPSKYFKGNLIGNIYTRHIKPISNTGNIRVHAPLLVSNVFGKKIVADNFYGTFNGNLIGNVLAVNTSGNFSGSFTGNVYGSILGTIYGNVNSANVTGDIINANIIKTNTLQVDTVKGKSNPYIDFNEVVVFNQNIIAQANILASNVIITNLLSVNPLSTIVATFSGSLTTASITEQTPAAGINVTGNIIGSDFFIGDVMGSIYASGLPSGRIVFTSTGGLLTSAAALTFNSGTSTLSTTTISTTGAITAGTTLTATTSVTGTSLTATTGAITATAGAISAGTTINSGTTITAGTNIVATTTVTAGTDVAATAGNFLINGSGKQLRVKGGTATADFIGQATLTAGTVTVNNTNIASTDRIFVSRSAQNASTAYGTFLTSISAGVSFTISSRKSDTTVETNDTSIVDYIIIRQI